MRNNYTLMIDNLITDMNNDRPDYTYSWNITSYGWFEAYVMKGNETRFLFSYDNRKDLYTALHGVHMSTLATRYI